MSKRIKKFLYVLYAILKLIFAFVIFKNYDVQYILSKITLIAGTTIFLIEFLLNIYLLFKIKIDIFLKSIAYYLGQMISYFIFIIFLYIHRFKYLETVLKEPIFNYAVYFFFSIPIFYLLCREYKKSDENFKTLTLLSFIIFLILSFNKLEIYLLIFAIVEIIISSIKLNVNSEIKKEIINKIRLDFLILILYIHLSSNLVKTVMKTLNFYQNDVVFEMQHNRLILVGIFLITFIFWDELKNKKEAMINFIKTLVNKIFNYHFNKN